MEDRGGLILEEGGPVIPDDPQFRAREEEFHKQWAEAEKKAKLLYGPEDGAEGAEEDAEAIESS